MTNCNDILTTIIDKCHELTLHNYNIINNEIIKHMKNNC